MNEQYSAARVYNPATATVDRTEIDRNIPAVGTDLVTDGTLVEAVVIERTPVGDPIALQTATAELPYTAPVAEMVVHEAATAELPYAAPVADPIVLEAATAAQPYTAPVAEMVVYEAATAELPYTAPVVAAMNYEAPAAVSAGLAALLNDEKSNHFRTRWNEIQGSFVDEPRTAVQQADALVSEAVEQITQVFATERSALENQWKQSNAVSTEDLRTALQRYRSFFNRLVA